MEPLLFTVKPRKRFLVAASLLWLCSVQNANCQYNMYSRLNPITYYGFTQPYLSGFYGGIGGMPYMSSWQASMFSGNNAQSPMGLLGLSGLGGAFGGLGPGGLGSIGGLGGGGFGSWNSAPSSRYSAGSTVLTASLLAAVTYLFNTKS